MHTSDSIKAISAALVAAQAELDNVPKDATNPHFKNTYASLAAVIDSSKPALLKQGLVVLQGLGEIVAGALQVTTRLLHGPSGEWIESTMGVPLAKQDAQGAGSAATYGRRYGLAALLCLAQVDDDGEEASKPQARPAAKPAAKPVASIHPTKENYPTTQPPKAAAATATDPKLRKIADFAKAQKWDAKTLFQFISDTVARVEKLGDLDDEQRDAVLDAMDDMTLLLPGEKS